MDSLPVHADNGFRGFLSCKVVVEETVDVVISLQFLQRPFQVVHGVHYKVVTGQVNANFGVSGAFQCQV